VKNTTKWILALITVATIALAGLGAGALVAAAGKGTANLPVGSEWTLASYGPLDGERVVLGETEITLLVEEDKIAGSAGCNRYFGGYEAGDGKFSTGAIGSTMMMCPGEAMAHEAAYLKALESASGYEVGEGTLRVFYNDGESVLEFVSAM
jgi:heat shock protein HslJ